MKVLSAIILLATILRFWQISNIPPSLTWDEVAWGYNAYSLGLDGRDEFGRFLPYDYLESFGDFKPPVYAYLDILPVKLFGLNVFSVRFPSAFFGILTVLISFFLVKSIFYNSFSKNTYGLLTAFILAISPWHIMLSRAAFEANIATFFVLGGIWLFLESIRGQKKLIVFSVISFVISVYTFNSARVVSPLLLLVLVAIFRNKLFQMKKEALLSFLTAVVMIIPAAGFLFSPQASLRFKEVNIFSDVSVIKRINQDIQNDGNTILSKTIHNRRFVFAVEYLRHYIDHFNPKFLFVTGDGNPKFSIQEVGQLYMWEIPFLVSGILFLFKRREGHWWIVPFWLAIAVIPAGAARETPHALRIENALPTFQIFVAYGLVEIFKKLQHAKALFLSFIGIIVFINCIYFFHDYFVSYPIEYSHEWQYGYKDSFLYAAMHENSYDKIVVTNGLGRPYIYYLFYSKTNPVFFREKADIQRDAFGFVHIDSIGKYEFTDFPSSKKYVNKKTLYIDVPSQIPKGAKILKTVNYLNKNPSLVLYEQ